MTFASTLQFISQVKLGELRRQRSSLLEEYDRLSQEHAARPPVEGLKALFDGLQKIKVAGKPLHPELGPIEILTQGVPPSADIVAFWRKRLEAELATGRLRADIVYLFGALLGEWGNEEASKQEFLDERRQAHESLLGQAVTPTGEAGRQAEALFRELFAGFRDGIDRARARINDAVASAEQSGDYNRGLHLDGIAQDIYQPADLRQEAKRFLENDVLQQQLDDALRVVTRDLHNWSWPGEGITTRALWTRNKWRLFPNLSLIQLCILGSLGDFWSGAVESAYDFAVPRINRLSRLHKLLDLNAPEVIIEAERRMLREREERVDLGWYEPVDPWEGVPPLAADKVVGGILSKRAGEQGELRDETRGGYYGGHGSNPMVRLIHAEVRTLRAAMPECPLFVARLDVRDYFASIPHSVLLLMLRGLGLPDSGLAAVRRFLEVPYLVEGQIVPARRGVPMDQNLSHWLAEWLLRLMERYVHGHARVRIIRQIDDTCLLAPTAEDIVLAWRSVHQFLQACGLDVNSDKCGACSFGAELPGELPPARPWWGMLELQEEGEWGIHEPTFRTFQQDTRKHVTAKHALLARVNLYNAQLRFLMASIGVAMDLGDAHRRSVNEALRRFEADFFGPGMGIAAGLRNSIRERYLGETQLSHLPEGWMYWPITAGGLGLRSAGVLGGQYQQAFEKHRAMRVPAPTTRPENWQRDNEEWSAYYSDQFKTLEPEGPKESKVMKALVEDFIARGQEISGGKQQSLSEYWRWILSIYGPEILDKFGTFRFLLTDLVPLQLIHEQLLHDSSLEE